MKVVNVDNTALLEDLHVQAQLDDLLRRTFAYPLIAETLAGLASLELSDEDDASPLAQGVSLLRRRLGPYFAPAPVGLSLPGLLESLNQEHSRLFIGPGPAVVSLYASFYISAEGRLFGEEALRVRQAYLAAGLAPARLGSIPDDHLALELEFLYFLTRQAALSLQNGDDTTCQQYLARRRDFVTQYLEPWAPAFCADILQGTQEPFFQGLAMITNGVLADSAA